MSKRYRHKQAFLLPVLCAGVLGVGFAGAVDFYNGFAINDPLVPKHDILHGGPPRDGIPAIDHPRFVHAGQVNFLNDDDRVLGIRYNGVAKAYAVKILNHHEIVNDQFNGAPVVVTYCPLCGTGMAFSAKMDGHTLAFGVSGLLYNSDVLLYDRQSESLWSQIMAKAVAGPMKGSELTPIPLMHTTWAQWRQRHGDTQVLSPQTGYQRDYKYNPYKGYALQRRLMFPVNHEDERLHPKATVAGVEINGEAKAYAFKALEKTGGKWVDHVGGKKITVYYDPDHRSVEIVDEQGNNVLKVVGYWFAWAAFHPGTSLFQ